MNLTRKIGNKFVAIFTLLSIVSMVEAKQSPNVVVFLVDDLRSELGVYGSKQVKSPNIDALAKQGVRFNHAYAQQAICGPSRVSIMTGLRPETLGIYSIDRSGRLRLNHPDVVSMPQLFKENGYQTISIGKVYHSTVDDQESWTTHIKKLPNFYAIEGNEGAKFAYEAGEVEDEFYKDGQVARDAISTLKKVKDQKFLMLVGLSKPHLPFNAPKKYWDLYDRNSIKVPSRAKPDNMHGLALTKWNELRMYGGTPKEGDADDETTKTLIHGYYASVSYMDAQVGKVMQALDDMDLRKNTLVVLMSDHGYKIGEYGAWNKHSNMEIDTRVPLIISRETSHKGRKTNVTSEALVENIDIFPTIAQVSGLPLPKMDGQSLVKLLDDPAMPWAEAAYSLHSRGKKYMGVTVTDGVWRYTEWRKSETQELLGKELYLHKNGDIAVANLAGVTVHKDTEQRMAKLLYKRFPKDAQSFNAKRELGNNAQTPL
ncbi:sulfatase [Paraglaciecola aquimarina]|uniref:Sulfatase n=1 Tax=Paraglaciecola algarum TaxID=3050085 RepID=A0ABS9D2W9_9ALTE|nr:sulfatase [Paraglaciecola sp. G1-23]MCF2946954.1 sulfatase [Paraglaciecola sp. G1-23]